MSRPLLPCACAFLWLAGQVAAQSFEDLSLVRNRPIPYTSLLQVGAGALAGFASDEDKAIGLESEIGWDGHAYYHTDSVGGRESAIDVFAGRYAAFASVREGSLVGRGTISRLEAKIRYFPFYREGFYSGGDFVPTGRYEGMDYGVGLSLGRNLAEDLYFEGGIFWNRRTFERNGDTPANYVIPDDYNAYGARIWLEHNTLALNRRTGWPDEGFILTVALEREQNDSSRTFGRSGVFESTLPSGVFRGVGHLEWFVPQGDTGVWEIVVDGRVSDKKDRVDNYDAYRPQGHMTFDGELRFRWELGESFYLRPFAKAQFLRILEGDGAGTDNEFFFGGGLEARLDLGETFSLRGHYSFLNNESRAPVSVSKDTFGEHQVFLGVEVRLLATRR